jgi:hypothetical protein
VTAENANQAEEAVKNLNVHLLWRSKDQEDHDDPMRADPQGGLGGYIWTLAALGEGDPLYFQVVACSQDNSVCAIDTGSKRRWNSAICAGAPAEPPRPIDAVSTKLPTSQLPE